MLLGPSIRHSTRNTVNLKLVKKTEKLTKMAKYQFLAIALVLVYAAIASTTSPEVTYEPCDPSKTDSN